VRRLALAAAVAATTLGSGVADASGGLRGKTSAGDPVGLRVDSRGRVYAFFYEGVRLECSDGTEVDTPSGANRVQTPAGSRFRVSAKGRWSISRRESRTGFGWDAAGRLRSKGARATGTLRVFATFDEQDNQDPDGSVSCVSGRLGFVVKRG
jgi:hypothetical protein